MSWLTSVTDGEVVYVAGLVVDAAGTDRGAAVWTASYRYDGPFHPAQAANDLAREVAANPDGVAPSPSSDAVQAAAACADDRPSA